MCGIAGYHVVNGGNGWDSCLQRSVHALNKRGPDFQNIKKLSNNVAFGHARLSIIDTSPAANQPMQDLTGRYTIVFNGEIFNFKELKQTFLQEEHFETLSDTEVLLHLFIRQGKSCLQHLNGFFAFAIYDSATQEVFLARDRFGIKPLHIFQSNGLTVFASELKAILQFPIVKELDFASLFLYLQLNYLPGEYSMLKNIRRLEPGSFAVIDRSGKIEFDYYYRIPYKPGEIISGKGLDYDDAKKTLRELVEASVSRRLVSDVPLGAFLSGGIDSSIVTACAARQVPGLNTFSVGFSDEPYYDETRYSRLVAENFKTNHTVFSISSDEMFSHIYDLLDYLDEPFADSSAIAVYILSQKTRQKVTVALSGDGGDELFAGYNKHYAELMARQSGFGNFVLKNLNPLISLLPQSRQSNLTNKFRQLKRYSDGLQLNNSERYWRWCALLDSEGALSLVLDKNRPAFKEAEARRNRIANRVTNSGDLNDVLWADALTVLPGDMLTKVDLMSMANSLEVRVPLLDYTVVNFAFSLPIEYKLKSGVGKRILKDAFRDVLPQALFNRPKRGFEVPLAKWIKTGLQPLINGETFTDEFIVSQGIFDLAAVKKLRLDVLSENPGDTPATAWALIVFQHWYKRYFLQ
jgi:asparagine synthase (glutamine-hydrolysing)